VENDSNLYADVDSVFQVRPVPTLVISSLIFTDNDSIDTWDLFTEKEIKSYFAIETIFEQAVKTHNFAVYDIASRDSIYKLFNLSIPENFRTPTTIELSCLENLKVDYYITGEFKRTEAGASVSLFLMQIVDKSVVLVKKESEFLYEDSLVKFKDVLLSLTKKLIE